MALKGECYRNQEGRLTQRIQLGHKSYFIKQHVGVGWKEIVKNLCQGRLPVISARNEWQAIHKLQALAVATPEIAAYGERGNNPARKESFVLMEELAPTISLEMFCLNWCKEKPSFQLKRQLITKVADIARKLHQNGINHRDFYICHFLLSAHDYSRLYLIDLHRAQMRSTTPKRWVIKDLVGLYFSSKDIGLTQRDLYRFMKVYRQKSLRELINKENFFWQKVKMRGEQLYRDHA